MDIYIKSGSHHIHLPINPSSFEITASMNNTTVNVHNLGEINLKGKRGLYSIGFSSFFPAQEYSFAKTHYQPPYMYIDILRKLFEGNKTVQLIITDTDINGYFTIESFTHGHSDGSRDVDYSLELKEYRTSKARVFKAPSTGTYTWKKGDTWHAVCKKKLGSSKQWKTVKNLNKDVIKKAKKKHPEKRENEALVGYKVVIRT